MLERDRAEIIRLFEQQLWTAKRHAVWHEDDRRDAKIEAELTRAMLHGEIPFDRDNYHRELLEVMQNPQYILMKTPEELDIMTELIPEIGEQSIHEKSHYRVASERGLQPIFGIYYVKLDIIGFRFDYQLFTSPGPLPPHISDNMYIDALRAMIAAPPDLSSSDSHMLGL